MRSRVASLVRRAAGWTAVGEVPRTGVLVGAPHTSNWGFVMLLIMWRGGASRGLANMPIALASVDGPTPEPDPAGVLLATVVHARPVGRHPHSDDLESDRRAEDLAA